LLNAPDHMINAEHEMLPKFSRASSSNMSLTERFMYQNISNRCNGSSQCPTQKAANISR
jgi:hypothetical protein